MKVDFLTSLKSTRDMLAVRYRVRVCIEGLRTCLYADERLLLCNCLALMSELGHAKDLTDITQSEIQRSQMFTPSNASRK